MEILDINVICYDIGYLEDYFFGVGMNRLEIRISVIG